MSEGVVEDKVETPYIMMEESEASKDLGLIELNSLESWTELQKVLNISDGNFIVITHPLFDSEGTLKKEGGKGYFRKLENIVSKNQQKESPVPTILLIQDMEDRIRLWSSGSYFNIPKEKILEDFKRKTKETTPSLGRKQISTFLLFTSAHDPTPYYDYPGISDRMNKNEFPLVTFFRKVKSLGGKSAVVLGSYSDFRPTSSPSVFKEGQRLKTISTLALDPGHPYKHLDTHGCVGLTLESVISAGMVGRFGGALYPEMIPKRN